MVGRPKGVLGPGTGGQGPCSPARLSRELRRREQVAGVGRLSPPSELGHRAHGRSRAAQRETAEDSRVLVQSEEEQDTGSRQDLSAGTPFHAAVASRRGYSPPLAQVGTSRLTGSLGLLRFPGLGDGWLRPGARPSPVTFQGMWHLGLVAGGHECVGSGSERCPGGGR